MAEQTLRIIAGEYRGRKLAFQAAEGLRPTSDRIRETLFNWLQPVITGARCLDMFAGSGLLGIEALSRGASEVVFIEKQLQACAQLQENIDRLHLQHATMIHGDVFECIEAVEQPFDIVFVDPPFHQGLLGKAVNLLTDRQLLKPAARVYLESEVEVKAESLPESWQIIRAKKAGQVFYQLAMTT